MQFNTSGLLEEPPGSISARFSVPDFATSVPESATCCDTIRFQANTQAYILQMLESDFRIGATFAFQGLPSEAGVLAAMRDILSVRGEFDGHSPW